MNAINVHSHAGTSRLVVSGNDEKIKIITLPTLQEYTSFPMPMAINFSMGVFSDVIAETSPDGKIMVAVGDLPKAYLFDTSSYGDYKKMQALTSTNDKKPH